MRACEEYEFLKFVSLFLFCFVPFFCVFFGLQFCWPLAKRPNNYESKCKCLGRFQNSIGFVNYQILPLSKNSISSANSYEFISGKSLKVAEYLPWPHTHSTAS